ncbi:hypothetical protein VNO77_27427 [Canavalia gladiata]|uniref:Uncharacterized protein n=1 Tax=Canavalia gladiata TaxID=3824 RepID=A0AAN9KU04_CANGL
MSASGAEDFNLGLGMSSRELQDKAPIYSSCNQAGLVSDLVPVSSSGQNHTLKTELSSAVLSLYNSNLFCHEVNRIGYPKTIEGKRQSLASHDRWEDVQNSCKAPIAASGLVDETRFQMVITETKIEYRNYQYDSLRAGLKSVTTKWLRQILGEIIRDYSYITTVHNPYHFTISVPALESVSQAYNLNQRASKLDYN